MTACTQCQENWLDISSYGIIISSRVAPISKHLVELELADYLKQNYCVGSNPMLRSSMTIYSQ